MQTTHRIADIETRARRIGYSLLRLCREAGAQYATVHRWKNQEAQPIESTANRHLGRLETKLIELERNLVETLSAEASQRTRRSTAA